MLTTAIRDPEDELAKIGHSDTSRSHDIHQATRLLASCGGRGTAGFEAGAAKNCC